MQVTLIIVGGLLSLVGPVWLFQGTDVLSMSFMSVRFSGQFRPNKGKYQAAIAT